MKILVLNPPAENTLIEFPNEKKESYIETKDYGCFPPLGALYVLSYLEKHTSGHKLFFRDCVAEKISHKELLNVISEIRPDVVGITSFTISLIDVCEAAKRVREIVPRVHLCLGGHHPIAFPFEAAQLKEFDSIIVGDGEIAFTELIKALEDKRDITQIRGVYTAESIKKWQNRPYKDKRFLSNVMVPPAYIEDIDSVPIPNRSYIQHIGYHSVLGVTNKLATIITSRGCPYRCTYCDVPFKKYRGRSVNKVVDEIENCLKRGYREFHFYDDLFNITSSKVIEFCDEVEKRDLKFVWDFRGRVNSVTRESLERARQAGCRMISFGVETGSKQGLKYIRKGTTVKKVKEVFKWCRELKIKTVADYMIGFPFEKTKEDVLKNIDYLIELDPDYALICVLCLYPNTELYNQAVARGFIKSSKWHDFSLHPYESITIDHWEEFLSTDELVRLRKKGYKMFYMRFGYIMRSIFNTASLCEFKTKSRGALKMLRS